MVDVSRVRATSPFIGSRQTVVSKTKTAQWRAREKLRDKGQFWTPAWVAEAMVAYAAHGAEGVYDPGVGRGAFARAAAAVGTQEERPIAFAGSEIDAELLTSQRQESPTDSRWLSKVRREDFLAKKRLPPHLGVVANPPYIRHHRMPADQKAQLRLLLDQDAPTLRLDGRAGLHVYFLVHALALLRPGARLSFILPADIAEGVFASALWAWIGEHYALDAVWRFDPAATPFVGVDTNPLVLCLRAAPPQSTYTLATIHASNGPALQAWVRAGFPEQADATLTARVKDLAPALKQGVGRETIADDDHASGLVLGDLVRIMRGIATGDNDFFFLTKAQAERHHLPAELFVRAIGRTRDAPGNVLTAARLNELETQERPTWLLSLNHHVPHAHLAVVRRYLDLGIAKGLPDRALIAQRKPWYRMERRIVPPWLFAYLGRRDARFIRNEAGAVPLTGFLCIYPRDSAPAFRAKVDQVLADPRVLTHLAQVGKTYGGGAIKVEPRNLERLPLPQALVEELDLVNWAESLKKPAKLGSAAA
jgi:adenine-specific DNA-methyltransferase